MPRNVIIVGPPRSGTSLASNIFARQNFFSGKPVIGGDDYNPFGYFEAEDIIEANVGVFQAAGFAHHNTWKFDPISDSQIERIGELAARDEDQQLLQSWNQHSPWMWKDPRFSITLKYWARIIDWDEVGVILTIRNPEDVYWSFRRKGWCQAGQDVRQATIRRIVQHAENARRVVDEFNLPHVAVEYGEYSACPNDVARRIGEFVGLELGVDDLNFHSQLDHSSGRGRLAGHARILLRKLPRGPMRKLAGLLPRGIQSSILPERGFVKADGSSAVNAAEPQDQIRRAG